MRADTPIKSVPGRHHGEKSERTRRGIGGSSMAVEVIPHRIDRCPAWKLQGGAVRDRRTDAGRRDAGLRPEKRRKLVSVLVVATRMILRGTSMAAPLPTPFHHPQTGT